MPAQLCSSQLAGRQALVTVVPRRYPRRIGTWMATWLLGDRPLATPARARHLAAALPALAAHLRHALCGAGTAAARAADAAGAAAGEGGAGRAVLPGQQRRAGHGRPVPSAGGRPGARRRCSRRCCWNRKCSSPTARRWWPPARWTRATWPRSAASSCSAQGPHARRAVALPGADGDVHQRRRLQAAARLHLVRRRRGGDDRTPEPPAGRTVTRFRLLVSRSLRARNE